MKKYQLGLYEKALPGSLSWEEKLKFAKEVGYDYIEMSIDASDERIARCYATKQERKEIIDAMYRADLPIRSMSVSALTKYALGDENEEVRNKGLEIGQKAIALAADLGIRTVMIPGYDIYFGTSTIKTKQYFTKNMKALVETAEKYGVLLGFETMENEFMNTVSKAMKYLTLMPSPYLKVYPDSGNITNAAVLHAHDVCEDLSLGGHDVIALHLKESKPGIFREVPYGEGHVEFERIIDQAWSQGVRRFVTEFWYLNNDDWKDVVRDAYARMSRILDKK